jgi:monoamine oxidase
VHDRRRGGSADLSAGGIATDVVIVGAGLAGAAAAARLREHCLACILLEARDRPGGRGYARAFAGRGDVLDFGGSWITPWQHRIRALAARHGMALRPRHPVTGRRWRRDDGLAQDGPAKPADRDAHARAMARIVGDAAHLAAGHGTAADGRPIAGVSFAAYLDGLDAPECTRLHCSAWWAVSGNGDKDRVPAAEFLSSCAYHDGTPEGMIEVWADTLEGGVDGLAQRMIAASGAALQRRCPVVRVSQEVTAIEVEAADGRRFAGRAAVIATGINPMAAIAFDPPLPQPQAGAVALGHLGRAVKVWAKVEGVPPGALATGGGRGLELVFAERAAADGTTYLVGFGVTAPDFDPDRPGDVASAIARFFPEARLVAHDWHDWARDPYARGAWFASCVGAEGALSYQTWQSAGRLAFASSDIAREGAGWFEAAVVSGTDAADALAAALAADRGR